MDFKELCEKRFSVRAYSGEPIPADKMSYIQECVRLAPSACNKQPWLFLAVKSEEAKKKLHACYDREWFAEAPLYIVACDRKSQAWTRRRTETPWRRRLEYRHRAPLLGGSQRGGRHLLGMQLRRGPLQGSPSPARRLGASGYHPHGNARARVRSQETQADGRDLARNIINIPL